jgi:2-hydroxychromene-2-carboxylate isomerase
VNSGAVHEFARRGCETVWARELDIADPRTIVAVADESGLSGDRLLSRAEKEQQFLGKEEALTDEAIAKRYFGGPTYVYRGEPFWGQDRLEMLDEVLRNGREPILTE